MITEKDTEEQMIMEEKPNKNNMNEEQMITEQIIQQEIYGYQIEDYAENQQSWLNAFNKNDPTYHNGDTTEVPLFGENLPESMPTPYEDGFDDKNTFAKVNVTNFDQECTIF